MTNLASTSPADSSDFIKPMLLWLGIQLLALAIGAAALPLSARRQAPPEGLAIDVMLVTQIAVSALLWPMLMANLRSAAAAIATAIPFMQAAGFISATPFPQLLPAGAMVFVWLITLAVLPQSRSRPTFMAALRIVVVTWSIGGALTTYLRAEFSADSSSLALGSVAQTLARLHGRASVSSWLFAGAFLGIAIAIRFLNEIVDRRKIKST